MTNEGGSSKSKVTREQLRLLMLRHADAATPVDIKPAAEVAPVLASPPPAISAPARGNDALEKKTIPSERCTLRLTQPELQKIDRQILEVHQRLGERITLSDILRIGLTRLTSQSPVDKSEILVLRASDGRRVRH